MQNLGESEAHVKNGMQMTQSRSFVPGIVVFTGIGTLSGPNIPLASNAAHQCCILNLPSNAGSSGCFVIASNPETSHPIVS